MNDLNIIFTDIDGVLQINNPKKWDKKCCKRYNDVCKKLNLKAVVTSTWRCEYSVKELQAIFKQQGIDVEIYDVTGVYSLARGEEIQIWLDENNVDKYVIIDDNVRDIVSFMNNVVAVEKSYIGMTDENVEEIEKIITYDYNNSK